MFAEVNYIKHLNAVYILMAEDNRLTPHHISLYLALFQMWNLNHFNSPVSISRAEMKTLSKIGSNNTYSRCLRQLDEFGYIHYQPSFNPMLGSKVSCIRFDTANGKAANTAPVQLKIPERGGSLKPKTKPGKSDKQETDVPPKIEWVLDYFSNHLKPSSEINLQQEAHKFYNHFSANGWKVGGKAPMKNWQAAARNWQLNAKRFAKEKQPLKPMHLQINTNKNYHEPL